MTVKKIDGFWDRTTRNTINDNDAYLDGRITGIVKEISDTAFEKVIDASKLNWQEPVDAFTNLPTEALEGDAVMTRDTGKVYRYNGTEWKEIQQIDAGPVNEVDSRLNQKIDDGLNSVNQQLAEITFFSQIAKGSIRYGVIEFPPDFPKTLHFQLSRDRTGFISHNYDFSRLVPSTNVYFSRLGSDNNDGLTESTAVKTITKAMEIVNGLSNTTVNIIFMDKLVPLYSFSPVSASTVSLSKNINFISNLEKGSYFFSGYDPFTFTWTSEGNAYKTARSAVSYVIDYDSSDSYGEPRELRKVSSLSECQSNRGSWYTDGTTVWVNTFDGSIPGNEIGLVLPLSQQLKFELGQYRMFIDKVGFWNHQSSANTFHSLLVNGDQLGRLYIKDSSFRYAANNGFAVTNVGETYIFNSLSRDNGYDGFNYHGSGDEFAFEYYCESMGNGEFAGGTGNATTAHDGMTIMRVSPIGSNSRGPLLADVNGCKSLVIDGKMFDSTLNSLSVRQSAAFYFDDALADTPGKAWLINCEGGGKNTFSLSSDGIAEIELIERFVGNKFHENALVNLTYTP